jgi:hypothetical protein
MKLTDEIPAPCKELLGTAVAEGDRMADMTFASDPSFLVGLGNDNRARYHHQKILESLQRSIRANTKLGLSAETVTYSRGHTFRIHIGRFVIFPRRLRNRYSEIPEPQFQRPYVLKNPTRQNDLFDPYSDPETRIVARLLFGKDSEGLFAQISVPDSAGGVYETIALPVTSGFSLGEIDQLPEEKAPTAAIELRHEGQSAASGA